MDDREGTRQLMEATRTLCKGDPSKMGQLLGLQQEMLRTTPQPFSVSMGDIRGLQDQAMRDGLYEWAAFSTQHHPTVVVEYIMGGRSYDDLLQDPDDGPEPSTLIGVLNDLDDDEPAR